MPGGSGGLGGDEDPFGFGFSEGEVVVPDTDFEGVAERGESAHLARGPFGEAEFEEALPDLGTEDESGDGGGFAGFQGAERDRVCHGIRAWWRGAAGSGMFVQARHGIKALIAKESQSQDAGLRLGGFLREVGRHASGGLFELGKDGGSGGGVGGCALSSRHGSWGGVR